MTSTKLNPAADNFSEASAGAPSIDPPLMSWMVGLLLDGYGEKDILTALEGKAVDSDQVRELLGAWLPNPLSQLALERARRLEWQVRTRQTLANLSEAAAQIPRTHNISRAELLERYYSQNQPVVIEGLVNDWPARTRWSGAYLKERFPGVEVHVSANRNMAPVYEQNTGRGSRPLRLAEYVEWVESIRESNELYMVARNNNLGLPALKPLLADIVMPPALLDASRSDGCAFIWYGPAGTVTPLHHDTTNILFCQVVGRKKLKLVSPLYTQLLRRSVTYYSLFDPEKPDFEQFPELRELRIQEIVLGAGDALFIPVGWWHHVRALDISISVSLSNFVWPNLFEAFNPYARPAT